MRVSLLFLFVPNDIKYISRKDPNYVAPPPNTRGAAVYIETLRRMLSVHMYRVTTTHGDVSVASLCAYARTPVDITYGVMYDLHDLVRCTYAESALP